MIFVLNAVPLSVFELEQCSLHINGVNLYNSYQIVVLQNKLMPKRKTSRVVNYTTQLAGAGRKWTELEIAALARMILKEGINPHYFNSGSLAKLVAAKKVSFYFSKTLF